MSSIFRLGLGFGPGISSDDDDDIDDEYDDLFEKLRNPKTGAPFRRIRFVSAGVMAPKLEESKAMGEGNDSIQPPEKPSDDIVDAPSDPVPSPTKTDLTSKEDTTTVMRTIKQLRQRTNGHQNYADFAKSGSGFGYKLLKKFGFQYALGKEEDGITKPVEVHQRPNLAGLGFVDEIIHTDLNAEERAAQELAALQQEETEKLKRLLKRSGYRDFDAKDRKLRSLEDLRQQSAKNDMIIYDMRGGDERVTRASLLSDDGHHIDDAIEKDLLQLAPLLQKVTLLTSTTELDLIAMDNKQNTIEKDLQKAKEEVQQIEAQEAQEHAMFCISRDGYCLLDETSYILQALENEFMIITQLRRDYRHQWKLDQSASQIRTSGLSMDDDAYEDDDDDDNDDDENNNDFGRNNSMKQTGQQKHGQRRDDCIESGPQEHYYTTMYAYSMLLLGNLLLRIAMIKSLLLHLALLYIHHRVKQKGSSASAIVADPTLSFLQSLQLQNFLPPLITEFFDILTTMVKNLPLHYIQQTFSVTASSSSIISSGVGASHLAPQPQNASSHGDPQHATASPTTLAGDASLQHWISAFLRPLPVHDLLPPCRSTPILDLNRFSAAAERLCDKMDGDIEITVPGSTNGDAAQSTAADRTPEDDEIALYGQCLGTTTDILAMIEHHKAYLVQHSHTTGFHPTKAILKQFKFTQSDKSLFPPGFQDDSTSYQDIPTILRECHRRGPTTIKASPSLGSIICPVSLLFTELTQLARLLSHEKPFITEVYSISPTMINVHALFTTMQAINTSMMAFKSPTDSLMQTLQEMQHSLRQSVPTHWQAASQAHSTSTDNQDDIMTDADTSISSPIQSEIDPHTTDKELIDWNDSYLRILASHPIEIGAPSLVALHPSSIKASRKGSTYETSEEHEVDAAHYKSNSNYTPIPSIRTTEATSSLPISSLGHDYLLYPLSSQYPLHNLYIKCIMPLLLTYWKRWFKSYQGIAHSNQQQRTAKARGRSNVDAQSGKSNNNPQIDGRSHKKYENDISHNTSNPNSDSVLPIMCLWHHRSLLTLIRLVVPLSVYEYYIQRFTDSYVIFLSNCIESSMTMTRHGHQSQQQQYLHDTMVAMESMLSLSTLSYYITASSSSSRQKSSSIYRLAPVTVSTGPILFEDVSLYCHYPLIEKGISKNVAATPSQENTTPQSLPVPLLPSSLPSCSVIYRQIDQLYHKLGKYVVNAWLTDAQPSMSGESHQVSSASQCGGDPYDSSMVIPTAFPPHISHFFVDLLHEQHYIATFPSLQLLSGLMDSAPGQQRNHAISQQWAKSLEVLSNNIMPFQHDDDHRQKQAVTAFTKQLHTGVSHMGHTQMHSNEDGSKSFLNIITSLTTMQTRAPSKQQQQQQPPPPPELNHPFFYSADILAVHHHEFVAPLFSDTLGASTIIPSLLSIIMKREYNIFSLHHHHHQEGEEGSHPTSTRDMVQINYDAILRIISILYRYTQIIHIERLVKTLILPMLLYPVHQILTEYSISQSPYHFMDQALDTHRFNSNVQSTQQIKTQHFLETHVLPTLLFLQLCLAPYLSHPSLDACFQLCFTYVYNYLSILHRSYAPTSINTDIHHQDQVLFAKQQSRILESLDKLFSQASLSPNTSLIIDTILHASTEIPTPADALVSIPPPPPTSTSTSTLEHGYGHGHEQTTSSLAAKQASMPKGVNSNPTTSSTTQQKRTKSLLSKSFLSNIKSNDDSASTSSGPSFLNDGQPLSDASLFSLVEHLCHQSKIPLLPIGEQVISGEKHTVYETGLTATYHLYCDAKTRCIYMYNKKTDLWDPITPQEFLHRVKGTPP